jgi:hypothetical protein
MWLRYCLGDFEIVIIIIIIIIITSSSSSSSMVYLTSVAQILKRLLIGRLVSMQGSGRGQIRNRVTVFA